MLWSVKQRSFLTHPVLAVRDEQSPNCSAPAVALHDIQLTQVLLESVQGIQSAIIKTVGKFMCFYLDTYGFLSHDQILPQHSR